METKMETKKCIHCNAIKTIDLFSMHGKQIRNVCKECRKLQQRLYYEQNKVKTKKNTVMQTEKNTTTKNEFVN